MVARALIHGSYVPPTEGGSRLRLSAATLAEARRLQRRDPVRNLARLGVLGALWAGGGGLVVASPWSAPLGWALMAGCLFGFAGLVHEACHGMLLPRPWNDVAGFLCGLPLGLSVAAYRALHLRHHDALRTEADPDDPENAAATWRVPLGFFYAVIAVAGTWVYVPHVAVDGLRVASVRARLRVLAELGLMLLVLGGACWLAPTSFVRLWLVPFAVAAAVNPARMLAEHAFTERGPVERAGRTIVSSSFVRFWLGNTNFHVEHHLFPGVPWFHLPALHRLLEPALVAADAGAYPSHRAYLRDVWAAWRGPLVAGWRIVPRPPQRGDEERVDQAPGVGRKRAT